MNSDKPTPQQLLLRAVDSIDAAVREMETKTRIIGFGGVTLPDLRRWEMWLKEARTLIQNYGLPD